MIAEWQMNEWRDKSRKAGIRDSTLLLGSSAALRPAIRPQNDRRAPAAATLRSPSPSNSSEHKQTASHEA
jgi:hypothetical protein